MLCPLQNYGIDINDVHQPLLVSKPKKRDIRARGGDDSPILLVPELCTRTGIVLSLWSSFVVVGGGGGGGESDLLV